jgi:hypothetical protein
VPCKITLWNINALPLQDSVSRETTGDHEQQDNSPALLTLESDYSMHSRSMRNQLSNGRQELLFSMSVILV